ncbi:hypothetical protein INP98_07260 [Haemophilus parainfluenzae]|uniref:hypothetical protein n=1 Tax=Haemophilus parainfluenzae TaxID=729 RepID=UPI0018A3442B|nr:hypothetical protein [Haemophilus parainfluenzae]QOR09452.1 hypothetical protein INP98_07260 [Haemophilus parainfluenzae]
MESMFGWAAINAILVAYGFGQKKWKFLIIPIAVKLCFWIASIYSATDLIPVVVQVIVTDVQVNVIAVLIGVGIGSFLREIKPNQRNNL